FERPRLHRKAPAAILGNRAEFARFRAERVRRALLHGLLRARHLAHGVAVGAPAVERSGGLAGGGHAVEHAAVHRDGTAPDPRYGSDAVPDDRAGGVSAGSAGWQRGSARRPAPLLGARLDAARLGRHRPWSAQQGPGGGGHPCGGSGLLQCVGTRLLALAPAAHWVGPAAVSGDYRSLALAGGT